jgi:hypothetical protein
MSPGDIVTIEIPGPKYVTVRVAWIDNTRVAIDFAAPVGSFIVDTDKSLPTIVAAANGI